METLYISTNLYIWKHYILAQTYIYMETEHISTNIYIWKHYILEQTYTYVNNIY